jgi:hypothetical protein
MKLLLCLECDSIFNLDYYEKKCNCGRVSGKYIDGVNAVYWGDSAYPLAFSNHSFENALRNQPIRGMGIRFDAFVVPKECNTFLKQKL